MFLKKKEIIILFIILFVLFMFLYNRWINKQKENEAINYNNIQKYLLKNDDDLGLLGNKKPILWIYVPHEYNSRNWLSFGSRSSFDLNQPYLYLCVKSIIQHCESSFHICLIDDNSFQKLIPDWNININKIASPILQNVREYGLAQLLYIYGGMTVPISFVCMKDLIGLYDSGVASNKIFVCENINRSVSSYEHLFYSDMKFMGSEKENPIIYDFIQYIKYIIQNDFTAETQFLGKLNIWLQKKSKSGQINLISGKKIGVKDMDDKAITVELLLGQNYINLYPETYGILIPSDDILSRTKYQWFARLSPKQVLEADTLISKYIILSNEKVVEQFKRKKKKRNWVGFWKTPLVDTWGLKPNFLGDNLFKDNKPNY